MEPFGHAVDGLRAPCERQTASRRCRRVVRFRWRTGCAV